MQTRSKTEQLKMEEAARTLMLLSQEPPKPLLRTLSGVHESYMRAMKIAPQTTSGDTILMNFYINRYQDATVQYMLNDNGTMKMFTIHDHYDNINIKWTYQVTDFPFYEEEHPIPVHQ